MTEIYLEYFSQSSPNLYEVPIETVIAIFTLKYCEAPLKIILTKIQNTTIQQSSRTFLINISSLSFSIIEESNLPINVSRCKLPNLFLNSTTCIAGLCGCLRQIIKLTLINNPEDKSRDLLGFKDACLLACAETSTWTKFCEVDLISTLKQRIEKKNFNSNKIELPCSIARFEAHMSQPVRLHNIFKYTMSKKYISNDSIIKNEANSLEHCYAEGSFLTLADIMIFVCINSFISSVSSSNNFFKVLPLTKKWYDRMKNDKKIVECLEVLPVKNYSNKSTEFLDCLDKLNKNEEIIYVLPILSEDDQSLYKSDAKRYKSKSKIFTKQEDVEQSIKTIRKIQEIDDFLNNKKSSRAINENFTIDWTKIPIEATPEGGSLPQNRLTKKSQQLENLIRPVMKLAKPGNVIVDFCSGGGHLGILIAYLLPECTVILLENKEISLNKSKKRTEKLNLKNVKFYQCNLDYFKGKFDIGMSLHACGVATDLVIQHCIKQNAIFVSCPCCYGKIKNCHHIFYPRSEIFRRQIELKDYLILSHAADQTHDEENVKTKQGYKCMDIIDLDRKFEAEEKNYVVFLSKLKPENCTPKNNLLIGIPQDKFLDEFLVL